MALKAMPLSGSPRVPQLSASLPVLVPAHATALDPHAVSARGKFLWVGKEKLYVRGVTYGTFRPNAHGEAFPCPKVVDLDFETMSANGINAIRTYTAPPRWLLDRPTVTACESSSDCRQSGITRFLTTGVWFAKSGDL